MPEIHIADSQHERIDALREVLADEQAGQYATVRTEDVIEYLLDLAATVENPHRRLGLPAPPVEAGDEGEPTPVEGTEGEPTTVEGDEEEDATVEGNLEESGTDGGDTAGDGNESTTHGDSKFSREAIRSALEGRVRQYSDSDERAEMDLYTIAQTYDVEGRSDMSKKTLVEAILDEGERLSTETDVDPFEGVDIVPPGANAASNGSEETGPPTPGDDEGSSETDDGQLNAMLSLLETHDTKWRKSDGDARYEVELPDGSVEQARTKDDVRATLFKNYR